MLDQEQINSNLFDDSPNLKEDVLIINSFGKMTLYYSLSDIVILGGSFTKMGGHNPIEPAHNNCVVITGPHIYNWENVFLDMINDNACLLCKNVKELDQYLAWTYYWNEHINHIAIDLSNYGEYFSDIIEEMENDLDLNMNISENDGKYQISVDSHLLQCSTKSDIVDELPKSYIEFVYREILPESKIKIFPTSVDRKEGFDPISANTIFKSTKL